MTVYTHVTYSIIPIHANPPLHHLLSPLPLMFSARPKHSYKILCPNLVKEPIKPEKAAEVILNHIALPEDQFRLGKTKVQNRKERLSGTMMKLPTK